MKSIKLLGMDVDGTLTDGSINISDNGELFKSFNVHDGMGVKRLQDAGVVPVIITGRESSIVERRAQELGIIEIYQNVTDKANILKMLADKYHLSKDEIAFIGDDVNDLPAMECAGTSFAPADAVEEVKSIVDHVLQSTGGHGAVRECAEMILKNKM